MAAEGTVAQHFGDSLTTAMLGEEELMPYLKYLNEGFSPIVQAGPAQPHQYLRFMAFDEYFKNLARRIAFAYLPHSTPERRHVVQNIFRTDAQYRNGGIYYDIVNTAMTHQGRGTHWVTIVTDLRSNAQKQEADIPLGDNLSGTAGQKTL